MEKAPEHAALPAAARDVEALGRTDDDNDRTDDNDNVEFATRPCEPADKLSNCSSSDDSSSSSSSSDSIGLGQHVEAVVGSTQSSDHQCISSMRVVGKDMVLRVDNGELKRSTFTTFRLRRWAAALAGRSHIGELGIRKLTLMRATQVFHAQWLLTDFHSDEAEVMSLPVLASCREALHHLYDHFKDILWGIQKSECPYTDAPVEMFMDISCDELYDEYLRFNDFVRVVAAEAEKQATVESVYELAAARILVGGREITVPSSSITLSHCRLGP